MKKLLLYIVLAMAVPAASAQNAPEIKTIPLSHLHLTSQKTDTLQNNLLLISDYTAKIATTQLETIVTPQGDIEVRFDNSIPEISYSYKGLKWTYFPRKGTVSSICFVVSEILSEKEFIELQQQNYSATAMIASHIKTGNIEYKFGD